MSSFGVRTTASLLLADVLTNVHSFVVIVTNHAGDDLYRFDTPCKPKSAAFYLRQVISSARPATRSGLRAKKARAADASYVPVGYGALTASTMHCMSRGMTATTIKRGNPTTTAHRMQRRTERSM